MKRYYFPHRYSTNEADTPRIKARAREMAMERWTVVDGHLAANGPYHLGERFSLVDFYMTMWAALGFEPPDALLPHFPSVRDCYERIASRPRISALLKESESMAADFVAAKAT